MTAPPPSVADLVRGATSLFEVPADEIVHGGRHKRVSHARFAVAWAAVRSEAGSLAHIGRALGGRQRSTILWAIQRADEMRARDQDFRERCDRLLATPAGHRSALALALLSI